LACFNGEKGRWWWLLSGARENFESRQGILDKVRQMFERLTTHRVVRNAALLYLVQLSSYLFPLLILPYLSRVLSREKFGLIAFSQMFIFYFMILTDYGFNLTATRDVAVVREDREQVSRIFSAVMVAKTLLTLLGLLLLVGVVWFTPKLRPDLDLYLLSFLGVVGNLLFPLWLYQGMERMDQVAMRDFAAKVLAMLIIFGFVKDDGQYLLAGAAQPVAVMLCGLAILWQVGRLGVRWVWPGWGEVREVFKKGWVPFLGLAAVSGASISNVVVLGLWSTPVEVAVFSGAQRIIIALRSLVSPVSTALYPYASQTAARSEKEVMEFVRRYVRLMAAPFLLFGVVMLVAAPWLLPWFLGPKYVESARVLQIMSMIPVAFAVVQIYSTFYILACGYDKEWMRITLFLTAFNLVVMFGLLTSMRGAHAIAWTSASTEVVAALLYWLFYRRRWAALQAADTPVRESAGI